MTLSSNNGDKSALPNISNSNIRILLSSNIEFNNPSIYVVYNLVSNLYSNIESIIGCLSLNFSSTSAAVE